MRIFLTGGTGFIGSNLTQALRQLGHSVTVASRLRGAECGPSLVKFDLANVGAVRKHLEGHDVCVHLACSSVPSTAQENPARDFQENVLSTIELAELCKELLLKQFIFCSSGGTVYGRSSSPSKESDPLRPISVYGAQKASIEAALYASLSMSYTKLKILRVSNPYGPHQNTESPQGLVGHLLRAAQTNSTFTVFGDGSQVRDYISVRDVVNAFIAVINYRGTHDTFNVGTGIGTSTNAIINYLNDLLPHEISVMRTSGRAFDLDYSVLDPTLLASEVGWLPRTGLLEGLSACVRQNLGTVS